MELETINKLYLELSQIATARTAKELALEEAVARRGKLPDLSPVIAWLENGCDPKEAAKELRIYQQRMRSIHDSKRGD